MFEFIEELFNTAQNKNNIALSTLQGKKGIISELKDITENYDNKNEVIKICDDLTNAITALEELDLKMKEAKKMFVNTNSQALQIGVNLPSDINLSEIQDENGSDELLILDDETIASNVSFDEIIQQIKNSNDFTDLEKEEIISNYEMENYDAILLLFTLHQYNNDLQILNNQIEELEKELDDLEVPSGQFNRSSTVEDVRNYQDKLKSSWKLQEKLEELNNAKYSLLQKIYDCNKELELLKFQYVYNLIGTSEFEENANVYESALECFEYIKENYKKSSEWSPGWSSIEVVSNLLENYFTDEMDVSDALYRNQVMEYLSANDEFVNFLVSVDTGKPQDTSWSTFLMDEFARFKTYDIPIEYSFLTEEEIKCFNYLYNTDKDAARNYIKALENSVNSRYGSKLANEDIQKILTGETSFERVLKSYGVGILPGVISWGENTIAYFTADDTKTTNEYRMQYVQQMLSGAYYLVQDISSEQLQEYIAGGYLTEEQYNELISTNKTSMLDVMLISGNIDENLYNSYQGLGNKVSGKLESQALGFGYGIGVSTGNMLPAIAVSSLFSGAGYATIGKVAANLMMFTSASGGSLKEAIRTGIDLQDAYQYATIMGSSEMLSGYFLGKIPFISKMDDFAKLSKKFWIQMVWTSLQEGGEEAFQAVFGATVDSLMLGKPIVLKDLTAETINSFFAGFVSSANLQTTSATIQTTAGLATFTIDELISCFREDGTIDISKFKTDIDNKIQNTAFNQKVDKTKLVEELRKYIDTITSEYGKFIPEKIKGYLNNILNFEDIVHIEDTGTISLFVENGEVYLPTDAYKVLYLLSKVPGFGINKKHTTHKQDNMIINNNTFLDFVSHVFLKGLSPKEYFSEILLHETLHLCGSDGAFALYEGFNELKTRELAQKYNLEASCCGYPKETRIAYELQNLFGKEIGDKLAFAETYSDKYNTLHNELGSEAAELFVQVLGEMEVNFRPYMSKSYPGILGIFNKCYEYSKIDYSKVYSLINDYRVKNGLETIDFRESTKSSPVNTVGKIPSLGALTSSAINLNSFQLEEIKQKLLIFANSLKLNIFEVEKSYDITKMSNVEIIDVNNLEKRSPLDRSIDTLIQNSYKSFDIVYKVEGDATSAITAMIQTVDSNKQYLIELNDTNSINSELISKLPDNFKIRINGGYTTDYLKGISASAVSYTLNHATYTVEEVSSIMSEIEVFESKIDSSWSDKEKALYAYNYLRENIKYNPNPGNAGVRTKEYSGLMSLVLKESTCQGFAQTYQELLSRLGIQCIAIPGSLNGEGSHAFNIISINNETFIVDKVRESLQGDFEGTGFIVENVLEYDFHAYNELNNSIKLSKIQELLKDNEKFLNIAKDENYTKLIIDFATNCIENNINIFSDVDTYNRFLDIKKYKMYLENESNDSFLYKILTFKYISSYSMISMCESFPNDTLKMIGLNYIMNLSNSNSSYDVPNYEIYEISNIIKSMENDENKLFALKYITEDEDGYYISSIIETFKTDEAKLKALPLLSNDFNKASVVETFKTDEAKLKALPLLDDFNKARVVETFKTDEAKLEALPLLNGYEMNIIDTLSKEYKIKSLKYINDIFNIKMVLNNLELNDQEICEVLEFVKDNGIKIELIKQMNSDKNKLEALQSYILDSFEESVSYIDDWGISFDDTQEKYIYKVGMSLFTDQAKIELMRKYELPEVYKLDFIKSFSNDKNKLNELQYIKDLAIQNYIALEIDVNQLSQKEKIFLIENLTDEEIRFKHFDRFEKLSEEEKMEFLTYFNKYQLEVFESLSEEYKYKSLSYVNNEVKFKFLNNTPNISDDIILKYIDEMDNIHHKKLLIRSLNEPENIIKYLNDSSINFEHLLEKIYTICSENDNLALFDVSLSKLDDNNKVIFINDIYNSLNSYFMNLEFVKYTKTNINKLITTSLKLSNEEFRYQIFNNDTYRNLILNLDNDLFWKEHFTEEEINFIKTIKNYPKISEFIKETFQTTRANNLYDAMFLIPNGFVSSDLIELILHEGYWDLFKELTISNDSKIKLGVSEFLDRNIERKDDIIKIIDCYSNIDNREIKLKFKDYITVKQFNVSTEQLDNIIKLLTKIEYSNATEINRLKNEIVDVLLETDSPLEYFSNIEDIFIRNNLPMVAKIYLVFDILHPKLKGFDFSNKNTIISPVLKNRSVRGRQALIFSDLLKSALGSNNRSIREYLTNIKYGNDLFLAINNNEISFEDLDVNQKEILEIFNAHLNTLFNNTIYGKKLNGRDLTNNLINDIHELYELFSQNGKIEYSLPDRIVRMFGYMADFNTYDEMINYLNTTVENANQRNRERATQDFKLEVGDFIKGINNIKYLGNILQNGSLSKEFLGADASSDATPLDTDLSRIQKDGNLKEVIDSSISSSYGPIWLVLKNDSRFNITRTQDGEVLENVKDLSKLEVFQTLSSGHYCIRTGFASSQIDYIVVDEYDSRIGFEIAKNGIYIPVVDLNTEQIVFKPEDYDNLRNKMSGLNYYHSEIYEFSDNLDNAEVSAIVNNLEQNEQEISIKRNAIIKIVSETLDKFGLKLKKSITGDLSDGYVELLDTGSTGRETNKMGDGDFDFIMRLDKSIMENYQLMTQISDELSRAFGVDEFTNGNFRLKNVEIEGLEKPVDIDITFIQKTNKVLYSSDMCLKDRLETIKKQSPEKYEKVIANIQLAKKVLKEGNCYKPRHARENPQGGLGGIGIENWILQHGGSFYDAAKDFLNVSSGKTFEEFVEVYDIWDFGVNHMAESRGKYEHDNFVNNLDHRGYKRMQQALLEFINNYD